MSENKFSKWDFNPAFNSFSGVVPFERFNKLPAGYYKIHTGRNGEPIAVKLELKPDALCEFVNGPLKEVYSEFNDFWSSESLYEELKITHKRGVLMYGPAGCGKTAIIGKLIRRVVDQGGIAIAVDNPEGFGEAIPLFRQIEQKTPIVAILEDIERFLNYNEEEILEILDGSSTIGGGIFYVATTNYLDKIPHRIKSRPSRIDTLIKIGSPTIDHRREYVKFMLPSSEKAYIDEIASNTKDFSLADIKEVIISTYVLKKPLKDTIKRLSELKKAKDEE